MVQAIQEVANRVDRLLRLVSLAIASVLLCIMVLLIVVGVAARWAGWAVSLPHDQVAGYLLVWITFIGVAAGFHEGFPRVAIVYDRYPPRVRWSLDIILLASSCAYSCALAYFAWGLVSTSRRMGVLTTGILTQPLWILQTGMALGLTWFALYLANRTLMKFAGAVPAPRREA